MDPQLLIYVLLIPFVIYGLKKSQVVRILVLLALVILTIGYGWCGVATVDAGLHGQYVFCIHCDQPEVSSDGIFYNELYRGLVVLGTACFLAFLSFGLWRWINRKRIVK